MGCSNDISIDVDKNDNNRRFNDEDYSSEEDVLDFDEYTLTGEEYVSK
jgi:hypothetical protein